jgi:hypothetical protein
MLLAVGRDRINCAEGWLRHDTLGVEPTCNVLQVAPSGSRRPAALGRESLKRCARVRNGALVQAVQRVRQADMQVYGATTAGFKWHAQALR